MTEDIFHIALLVLGGAWMMVFPNHTELLVSRFQALVIRCFPIMFREYTEAPLFSRYQIRVFGVVNWFVAIVFLTKLA